MMDSDLDDSSDEPKSISQRNGTLFLSKTCFLKKIMIWGIFLLLMVAIVRVMVVTLLSIRMILSYLMKCECLRPYMQMPVAAVIAAILTLKLVCLPEYWCSPLCPYLVCWQLLVKLLWTVHLKYVLH